MARYVDGFLLPVPKKKIEVYRRIAAKAGRLWMKYGALAYVEAVGEDLKVSQLVPFTRAVRVKPGETVAFSYIVFKSRAHRDRVNAKVIKDPSMQLEPADNPIDMKRMVYGGFRTIVDL